MASRISHACNAKRPGICAGTNSEHGAGDAAELSPAVVHEVVQNISAVEKNTCAFDRTGCKAGACADERCIIRRLRRFHRLESKQENSHKKAQDAQNEIDLNRRFKGRRNQCETFLFEPFAPFCGVFCSA